jgi:deoxyribodipyrimidine photo-lyase
LQKKNRLFSSRIHDNLNAEGVNAMDTICKRNAIRLNQRNVNEEAAYVLYWMQQSQRVAANYALAYAIRQANCLKKPLVVAFALTNHFPQANERHYRFMLEGLENVATDLAERGIQFALRIGEPVQVIEQLAQDAALVVADSGFLRIQRQWRKSLAETLDIPLYEIESDVVVPVREASNKEEHAARTIRPKINRIRDAYLVLPEDEEVQCATDKLSLASETVTTQSLLPKLKTDQSATVVSDFFKGGYSEAKRRLNAFLSNGLRYYSEKANDPRRAVTSCLSPYLHFGQISSVEVALAVQNAPNVMQQNKDDFLEQLIVRRELAMNFVFFNDHYDQYACIPDWAKETLEQHKKDPREYVYSAEEFAKAQTHDPYWNAAQKQMLLTGHMHNYMRMYWGKKIMEWSREPEQAFEIMLDLNNQYELDGRDPNGFTGVAWCFGKHDRGWTERSVMGKTRYMNANGLKRKFDIDAYVANISSLEPDE